MTETTEPTVERTRASDAALETDPCREPLAPAADATEGRVA